jgi:hypothetical protein
VDATFLRDQGLITPVEPITDAKGQKRGARHYRVECTIVIRVVDRHLECENRLSSPTIESGVLTRARPCQFW